MKLEPVNDNGAGEYRMELANGTGEYRMELTNGTGASERKRNWRIQNGAGERNWNVGYQLKRVHHWATVESIHTLTRCSLDKAPSCSQCLTTFIVVEPSSQITPSCTRGVVDGILYNPLPILSRIRGFLFYLSLYRVWHKQNVSSQFIIVNCGSDHGDVLKGKAVV